MAKMPLGKTGLLCLASLIWACSGALGDDRQAAALSEIRPAMQSCVEDGEIAGAVTLVGRKDCILHHEAVGMLNLETRQPMTRDALFRIASMTKPMTAIAIMMLVDEGKLSIDDEVEKHLPEFRGQMLVEERTKERRTLKNPSRAITVRDLLTHTSGLPGTPPPGLAELYLKRDHTLAEGVIAFSQMPLNFEPGTKWSYSNLGIDTLGRIIEVISGQSYETFLQQRLFDPLGMKDTTFYPTAAQLQRLAITYEKDKAGRLVPAMHRVIDLPPGSRYPMPSGGLYSTAEDVARLYQMMLNRGAIGATRILSPQSVKMMTSNQTGDLPIGKLEGIGMGFGWVVVRRPVGITAMLSPGSYGHGGAFATHAWVDPIRDVFVVLLIQRAGMNDANDSRMRRELQTLAIEAADSP